MILFVDMDEVIADACGAFLERYNLEFNESVTLAQCHGREVWEGIPEERRDVARRYHHEDGFFRNLKPIANSQEILKALTQKYNVYIASAAMEFPNSLREKSEWLDEHFPFIHWKKRILCGDKHILKGDILIDDRSFNLDPFEGRTIMFTSPHNVNSKGHQRANNWQEVGELLL